VYRGTRTRNVDLDQLFLGLCFFLRLLLTVVVRHGDDGQDEVDQIERAEKDDEHEKEHVIQPVRSNNLLHVHAQTFKSALLLIVTSS